MKALLGLINVLSLPLMVLNLLGGIVSGIWLAILGEWGTIGWGILAIGISTFGISLALMPVMLLAVPVVWSEKKGKSLLSLLLSSLGGLYTLGVLSAWCLGVLFFFTKEVTHSGLIPTLIWSYGVAIGPWSYMASKERPGGGSEFYSLLATFFAEIAYVSIILIGLFTSITRGQAIIIFLTIMAIAFMTQLFVAYVIEKTKNAYEGADFL